MSASPLSIRPRNLLRIAVPISLGSLVQFFVVLTDNFFLSRAGELELNAAGNAALVYLTFVMVLTGGSMGIQILVARHQGADQGGRMAVASERHRGALYCITGIVGSLRGRALAAGVKPPRDLVKSMAERREVRSVGQQLNTGRWI